MDTYAANKFKEASEGFMEAVELQKRLRRTEFFYEPQNEILQGNFHCWAGLNADAFALIELGNGDMVRVSSEHVKFRS